MILVIGAAASGKRAYVESLGFKPEEFADAVLNDLPVMDNLQDLVLEDPAAAGALLTPLLKKEVVICDEVGSGVIPIVAQERLGREACGRLCIQLAKEATRVVRLICGIPKVIKD